MFFIATNSILFELSNQRKVHVAGIDEYHVRFVDHAVQAQQLSLSVCLLEKVKDVWNVRTNRSRRAVNGSL